MVQRTWEPWAPTWEPNELLEAENRLAEADFGAIPGQVVEDLFIPARGFMRARTVKEGHVIRFIDVAGEQVPDVILYEPSNLKNCSSMTNTQLVAKSWAITEGHSIYAKFGQKMATIIKDTVGDNVVIGGFCNAEVNDLRYGVPGTHGCRMNLVASMAEYNLGPADIEEGVFAPFMNMKYKPDGSLFIEPPRSKAGDHLDLRADMDILVAVSNCPSEHNPCNGWNPTPLRVVVYRPGGSGGDD